MSLHAARVRDAAVDAAIRREAFDEIPRTMSIDEAAELWRDAVARPVSPDHAETVMAYRRAKATLAMRRGGLSPEEIERVLDA